MSIRQTLLPSNLEAELVVIGGIMIDNTKLYEVGRFLLAEDFYDPRCALAYRKITGLADAGRIADTVSVGDLLDKSRKSEFPKLDVDGFLREVSDATPSAANTVFCAGLVHKTSQMRSFIKVTQEHNERGLEGVEDVADLVASLNAATHAIADRGTQDETLTAAQAMDVAEARFNARLAGELIGTLTGFDGIDALTNGFLPGQFVIVAGRPGSGKSSLASNIAQNIVGGLGAPVLIFNMEMETEDIMDRMAAPIAGIDGANIKRPASLNARQIDYYRQAAREVRGFRLKIDSKSNSMTQIVANSRRHRFHEKTEIIFIDYIQLIDAMVAKKENRQEQVAGFSRRLKMLARELRIPIVALAQINRDSDKQDRRPRISDLRESGQIEADADIVLLLHRHELNNPGEKVGEAECIVAKNRNGATGIVKLEYLKHFTKFETIPEPPTANGHPNSPVF